MEEMKNLDEVIKLLEKLGHRLTPQRILVTKIILENVKRHPSFKEIHELASQQLPRLGVSTTYTIMKMLEEAGVITTFEANGETHIDSPYPHVNVVCEDTGQIFDIPDDHELVELITSTLRSKGIQVRNPTIIVKGLCNEARTN